MLYPDEVTEIPQHCEEFDVLVDREECMSLFQDSIVLSEEPGILCLDVLFFRLIFLSAVGEYRSMEVFFRHENVLQIPLGVRVLMGTYCHWVENLRIHHASLEREFLEDYDPGEEMGDLR